MRQGFRMWPEVREILHHFSRLAAARAERRLVYALRLCQRAILGGPPAALLVTALTRDLRTSVPISLRPAMAACDLALRPLLIGLAATYACLWLATWLHQQPCAAHLHQQALKTLARGQA